MRRKIGVACVSLVMLVLLGVAAYAGYQLYLSHMAYAQGDETYEQIAQQVVTKLSPTAAPQTAQSSISPQALTQEEEREETTAAAVSAQTAEADASAEAAQADEIPQLIVDYTALAAISANAVGWLYCPDTVIDYPVMQAEDNSYYLRHLPDGTYNINGSLFLDYSCAPDFSDRLSVIYGHNMKTEKMFASLVGYKDQAYYDAHPYLYLYTEAQNYRIALLWGAIVSDSRWTEEGFSQNAEGLMEYAEANTTFVSSEEYTADQPLVVLSTCSYEYDGARYIVVGLLQPA